VYAGQPGILGNSDAGKGLLNLPRGLAIDSKNNLFIADQNNGSVRKVTPDGKISTVAKRSGWPSQRCSGILQIRFMQHLKIGSDRLSTKIGVGRIFDESKLRRLIPIFIGGIVGQPSFNPNAGLSIDSRGASPSNNLYIKQTDSIIQVKSIPRSGKFVKKLWISR
jgi:hypothetical protein